MAAKKAKPKGKSNAKPKTKRRTAERVNRDSLDLRDLIYRPALVDLKPALYPVWGALSILDQGEEGACTGFGLAAVINYLNVLRGDKTTVSARMLYEMAKHHDQWPGNNYDGSSSRGAMKGWFKNGVCPEKIWRNVGEKKGTNYLTHERQMAALKYPLGAYYRVLPKRSDVHAALNEVGVVYAAADTHKGWDNATHVIPYKRGMKSDGGHAFAIVGYTPTGFLIQNSWGPDWGGFKPAKGKAIGGVAEWSYEDFDCNAWDLWVVRPALAVESLEALRTSYSVSESGTRRTKSGPPRHEIQDDYVQIDNGAFRVGGDYSSSLEQVKESIHRKLGLTGNTKTPNAIMLYAHGGLNEVDACAERVGKWKPVLDANGVSQLHFIWKTGFFTELCDVIFGKDKNLQERAGSVLGSWKDQILEKMSKAVGHAVWKEMRIDADDAFKAKTNAGYQTLEILIQAWNALPAAKRPTIHFTGHSAGSILGGHMVQAWQKLKGPAFESYALLAPACTVDFFDQTIAPAMVEKVITKLHRFQLTDDIELDDTVGPYGKSLLYLVSNVFEDKGRVSPLLGMEKFDKQTASVVTRHGITGRFITKTSKTHPTETQATEHGGFDNDPYTMNALLKMWVGSSGIKREFKDADLN